MQKPTMFTSGRTRAFLGCLLSLLFATAAWAQQSVILAWDPSTDSDVTGYTVYLGTASGTFDQVQSLGVVTSATLDNLTPSTTYYCTVQAHNAAGVASEMAPEIAFTTRSATTQLLVDWAKAAGLSGDTTQPDAMPFGDGVANLVKYAFNMNAGGSDARVLTAGSGTAGLPRFTLTPSVFKVEFVRRKNSGLVYVPQVSTDLIHFQPLAGNSQVQAIDTNWERVIIQQAINRATTPRLFGKVEVTLP